MKDKNHSHGPRRKKWTFWLFGLGSLLWLLLRSGANPRRLAYPCQRSALAGSLGFVGYVTSVSGSAHLYQRLKRTAALTAIGLPVLVLLLAPLLVGSNVPATPVHADLDLPGWTSPSAVSNVFVAPNVPAPECSLDGGSLPATPPCDDPSYALRDAGVDSLVSEMEVRGDYFYRTTAYPAGIVGADDVVVIKINNQWGGQGDGSGRGRLSTNTDVLKGLIWRILQHPEGFTGEVVVAENTQDVLPNWDITPANAQDQNQSYQDVADAFQGLGYPISLFTWDDLGDNLISGGSVGGAGYPSGEYAQGNYDDAYILLEDPAGSGTNELSYPKFQTAGGHYVSMRYGVWDGSSYDADRLTFINAPVLKRHGMAGATIAWKNLIGFLTIRNHDVRYGSWDTMHDYFWGYTGDANRDYGLIGREMALIRVPDLNVVDAIWVGIDDNTSGRASRQDILVASTDPFAVDWYASEYVLRPVAAWPEDASAARAGTFRDATRANQNAAASTWRDGSYPYMDLLDSYDGSTPSDDEKNQMNAYVVAGAAPATSTPTATATPTPTSTPTATPTVPASACLTDANANGRVDVVDIETTAQDQDCIVYLPLIASHWREPWSAVTPTPTATPTTSPATDLIQPADLVYQGAFRLPDGPENIGWEWSGAAMAYYPNGDPDGPADGFPGSIFGTGHNWNQWVSEISIPVPVNSPGKNVNNLPTATTLQDFHNIRGDLFSEFEIPRAGLAYLPAQGAQTTGKLYFGWAGHAPGNDADTGPTHGWSELDLSRSQSAGVWRIGGYPKYVTADYMFPIPPAWADAYTPDTYLATGRYRDGGQAAEGPALFAIGPWNQGNPPPSGATLPATPLLLYESVYEENPHALNDYHHSDEWSGGVWLTTGDKSAVIFVGTKGTGDCWYGCADGTVWPDEPPFPPDCPERGWWSTGFEGQILFYDPADLAAVAEGEMETWEPQPYAVLNIDEYLYHVESTRQKHHAGAAGFDRERGLLYVFEPLVDGDRSLVHVWRVVQ